MTSRRRRRKDIVSEKVKYEFMWWDEESLPAYHHQNIVISYLQLDSCLCIFRYCLLVESVFGPANIIVFPVTPLLKFDSSSGFGIKKWIFS